MAEVASPKPTLFRHQNGQYAKKIRGKLYYFGTNEADALKRYWAERDDLQAGRHPQRVSGDVTVEYMVDAYIVRCEKRVKVGVLSGVSLADYRRVGELLKKHLGSNSDPTLLTPAVFTDFYLKMVAKYAPSRYSKIITVTKSIFKWAGGQNGIGMLTKIPSFGPDFKVAPVHDQRKQKSKGGKKLLTRDEMTALLKAADPKWKAILLLCINGGLGNSDIARIKLSDVGGQWLELVRGKTGIERRIPLWPETQEAIKVAISKREKSKSDLLFVSGHGQPLIVVRDDGKKTDLTCEGFRRIAVTAGISRPRMGLYWCRHTFQTIGDAARDPVATSAIMGHADHTMAGNYREGIEDDRLLRVIEHIRAWLFKPTSSPVTEAFGVG